MDNDPQKDELKVEHYNAETAKKKREEILSKVWTGVVAAVVLGFLGLIILGSTSAVGGSGAWYASVVVPLDD